MRNLNLDQLRTLTEVIEQGSFTAAAKRLNLSQPAVSLQVRELEERFGIKLIERLGKRAYATPAGQDLVAHGRRIAIEAERAETAMRRYREGWLGRVRIGSSTTALSYHLPPILRHLYQTRPNIELTITTGATLNMVDHAIRNEIDIGLVTLPVDHADLVVMPLLTEPLVAILPRDAGDAPLALSPGYFATRAVILETVQTHMRRQIAEWMAQAGFFPHPSMEVDSIEAIKSIVATGLGISIVPDTAVSGKHASDELTIRQLDPPLARTLAIIHRRDKPLDAALSYVKEELLSLAADGGVGDRAESV